MEIVLKYSGNTMEIDSVSLREIEARDKNQEPRQYQLARRSQQGL
jgi:hypothetical protein